VRVEPRPLSAMVSLAASGTVRTALFWARRLTTSPVSLEAPGGPAGGLGSLDRSLLSGGTAGQGPWDLNIFQEGNEQTLDGSGILGLGERESTRCSFSKLVLLTLPRDQVHLADTASSNHNSHYYSASPSTYFLRRKVLSWPLCNC